MEFGNTLRNACIRVFWKAVVSILRVVSKTSRVINSHVERSSHLFSLILSFSCSMCCCKFYVNVSDSFEMHKSAAKNLRCDLLTKKMTIFLVYYLRMGTVESFIYYSFGTNKRSIGVLRGRVVSHLGDKDL